jgi:hypothetical protein
MKASQRHRQSLSRFWRDRSDAAALAKGDWGMGDRVEILLFRRGQWKTFPTAVLDRPEAEQY